MTFKNSIPQIDVYHKYEWQISPTSRYPQCLKKQEKVDLRPAEIILLWNWNVNLQKIQESFMRKISYKEERAMKTQTKRHELYQLPYKFFFVYGNGKHSNRKSILLPDEIRKKFEDSFQQFRQYYHQNLQQNNIQELLFNRMEKSYNQIQWYSNHEIIKGKVYEKNKKLKGALTLQKFKFENKKNLRYH